MLKYRFFFFFFFFSSSFLESECMRKYDLYCAVKKKKIQYWHTSCKSGRRESPVKQRRSSQFPLAKLLSPLTGELLPGRVFFFFFSQFFFFSHSSLSLARSLSPTSKTCGGRSGKMTQADVVYADVKFKKYNRRNPGESFQRHTFFFDDSRMCEWILAELVFWGWRWDVLSAWDHVLWSEDPATLQ